MTVEPAIIERIELRTHRASARSSWTVLEVRSSTGLVGIGECSDGGDVAILDTATRRARAELIGRPVTGDRTALRTWLDVRRREADRASALAWSTALGGLEAALDDLAARHAGVTLARFLGSTAPERVRLYANLNRTWGAHALAELVRAARSAAAGGFPAVKVAPFDAAGRRARGDELLAAGLEVVDAVRAALPDETRLMIDCHFRLDGPRLRAVLPELAAREVFWIEDAVDARDVDGLCRVREQTSVALAAGEHEWDPAVVEAACASGAVDYWLIDPKHAGGPRATRQLIDLTGAVAVSYHNPSGPIGTAQAAQLSALSPRLTWLEYAWGEPDRATYLSPAEKIENGWLVLADGPGIGVALATPDAATEESA